MVQKARKPTLQWNTTDKDVLKMSATAITVDKTSRSRTNQSN